MTVLLTLMAVAIIALVFWNLTLMDSVDALRNDVDYLQQQMRWLDEEATKKG